MGGKRGFHEWGDVYLGNLEILYLVYSIFDHIKLHFLGIYGYKIWWGQGTGIKYGWREGGQAYKYNIIKFS